MPVTVRCGTRARLTVPTCLGRPAGPIRRWLMSSLFTGVWNSCSLSVNCRSRGRSPFPPGGAGVTLTRFSGGTQLGRRPLARPGLR